MLSSDFRSPQSHLSIFWNEKKTGAYPSRAAGQGVVLIFQGPVSPLCLSFLSLARMTGWLDFLAKKVWTCRLTQALCQLWPCPACWSPVSHSFLVPSGIKQDIFYAKLIEHTTARVHPSVNLGLWVEMLHQCRFIMVTRGPLWGAVQVGTGEQGTNGNLYISCSILLRT